MDNVRWGILSTANIGRQQVVPAIQAAARCEVVAVASRSLQDAADYATDLGIERPYGSYGQLLHDPDIDAVYIPLPNHMHARWAISALESGKHVLCEKPIAMTSGEAEAIAAASAAAGLIVREAFMYRFHPTWIAAMRLINEGAIGEVTAVDSWYSYFNDDQENIRNVLEYGGGALMDIGCYPVHLSRMLFASEPTEIKATVRRDPVSGVDTLTTAILEFGDKVATFGCSTRSEPDQRVDIYGTAGRISIDIPFNIPPDRSTRISVIAGGNPPVEPATRAIEVNAVDQYTLQAEAYAAAVLDGTPVPDSGADIVGNIRAIERVFAATGPSGWA